MKIRISMVLIVRF